MSDFNLFIYKKKSQFIFSISFVFNFQKKVIYTYYIKYNLLQNFNLATKITLQKKKKNFVPKLKFCAQIEIL